MKQEITKRTGISIDVEKPIEELIVFLKDLKKKYPKSWFEKDEDGEIEHFYKKLETNKEYQERIDREQRHFEAGKKNAPHQIKLLESQIFNIKEKYGIC